MIILLDKINEIFDNINMNEIKPINPIVEIHITKESSKKEDMKKKKIKSSKNKNFVNDILKSKSNNDEVLKNETTTNQQSVTNLKSRIDFDEEKVEDSTNKLWAKKLYTN